MLKGTTANISITGASMAMGTIRKTILSAPPGVRSSLKMSLTKSAMGWSSPKGPHRFGPNRFCIRPISFRSIQEKMAAPSNTPLTSRNMMRKPATK